MSKKKFSLLLFSSLESSRETAADCERLHRVSWRSIRKYSKLETVLRHSWSVWTACTVLELIRLDCLCDWRATEEVPLVLNSSWLQCSPPADNIWSPDAGKWLFLRQGGELPPRPARNQQTDKVIETVCPWHITECESAEAGDPTWSAPPISHNVPVPDKHEDVQLPSLKLILSN